MAICSYQNIPQHLISLPAQTSWWVIHMTLVKHHLKKHLWIQTTFRGAPLSLLSILCSSLLSIPRCPTKWKKETISSSVLHSCQLANPSLRWFFQRPYRVALEVFWFSNLPSLGGEMPDMASFREVFILLLLVHSWRLKKIQLSLSLARTKLETQTYSRREMG